MFANPGLSGGRGPSCWPNNRRLKGECRARGAPAPTAAPPTASLPGDRPPHNARGLDEKRCALEAWGLGLRHPSAHCTQAWPGAGPSRHRRRPLRSVTPAFSAAPGPAPAPR